MRIFITLLVIFNATVYAQTDGELEGTINNCKNASKNSYWHEAEKICTNTFKTSSGEIIRYVGGWSIKGAKGYGQLYVYDKNDGSLTDMYKGQFLESAFHGFGRFEERYLNDEGELIISTMIGNWNDGSADGFFFHHKINHQTKESYSSYGGYNSGVKKDTFVAALPLGTFRISYENGAQQNMKQSKLLMDDTSYAWVQHYYFGNTTTFPKNDNAEHSASIK
jgi:hypothetical protein